MAMHRVFNYTSKCCLAPAVKPEARQTKSLGAWSCTRCNHKAKINRTKAKEDKK